MTTPDYDAAVAEATRLSQLSDEALYRELGLRIGDVQNAGGFDRVQMYSAEFKQDSDDMLSVEDLKKVGRKWAGKLETELLGVLCTEGGSPELKQVTQGKTIPQIAATLATAAVVAAFGPPAWAIVGASILATKISQTGLDAMCEVWRESHDARTAASTKTAATSRPAPSPQPSPTGP